MNIYGQIFPETSFVLLVLMISRLFSYYLSLIWSGVFTLTYHMVKVKKVTEEEPVKEQAENAEESEAQKAPEEENTEEKISEEERPEE